MNIIIMLLSIGLFSILNAICLFDFLQMITIQYIDHVVLTCDARLTYCINKVLRVFSMDKSNNRKIKLVEHQRALEKCLNKAIIYKN